MMTAIMLMSSGTIGMNENYFFGLTELTGYKLRHADLDYRDFNLWVVTSEDVFEQDFEPEHDSVVRPQFENQMVLAAKVETRQNLYSLRFRRTQVRDGALNVYFSVKREGSREENIQVPVSMIVVPKDKAVKKVNFFHDHILVKTVPIVTVY